MTDMKIFEYVYYLKMHIGFNSPKYLYEQI